MEAVILQGHFYIREVERGDMKIKQMNVKEQSCVSTYPS